MRKTTAVASLLALAFAIGTAYAGRPTGYQGATVTSVIEGSGTNRVEGDQAGPYVNGVGGVSSILQSLSADYVLDLTSSPRTIRLDFTDPVPNTSASPPFNIAQVTTRIIQKCSDVGLSLPAMVQINSTIQCPFSIGQISYAGSTWHVIMNSLTYPATNFARVTCNGLDSQTHCNSWQITASTVQPDGQLKNRVHLARQVTVRGKTVMEDHGDYYMNFAFDISIP